MSLSGDKGVAQFKKSVKMEHPNNKAKLMKRLGKITRESSFEIYSGLKFNLCERALS